jgi:hypothetical protein
MAYTTINKSTDYFNTKLHTGNGSTQSITGVGFQPDFTWIKDRSGGNDHQIVDSVRGATKAVSSNRDDSNTFTDGLTSFDSDGYTLGLNTRYNGSSTNYVGWNWLAGTTSGIATDAESDITPTGYSFNQTSGCSIVTYTGTGTSAEGVPHGLGAKPKWYMVKRTDTTGSWQVYTQPNLDVSNATKYLRLNATDAEATNTNRWQGYQPDATNFYLGNSTEVNASGGTYVAYVFAEKQGYSRIGKYTGNGNADGPFIYTGFRPSFVLIKEINGADIWAMYDDKRLGYNVANYVLESNNSGAEGAQSGRFELLSNGFKITYNWTPTNTSGQSYIYLAFGQSLVGSNNVPCTAR